MADAGLFATVLLLGLAGGATAVWFLRRGVEPPSDARVAALATAITRLSHDLRGTLSPALLMAERLERHPDANVRQAADVIAKATERASVLCRETSVAVKRLAAGQ